MTISLSPLPNRRPLWPLWLLLAICCVTPGCQREAAQSHPTAANSSVSWQPVAEESMTDLQRSQMQRAITARDAVFNKLMARLQTAIGEAGPAGAVRVCQKEAPEIAAAVAQSENVRIGRTSFKLRNPLNAPPDWATPLIEQRVKQPAFVTQSGQTLGVLLPIRLKQQCLICHGSDDDISPTVRDALRKHYPQDQATGFAVDDLRGWFWVEVPLAAVPAAPDQPK